MTEALLNEKQVAALLGVQVSTVRDWRKAKRRCGPCYVKIGVLVRYRLEALEAYLKSRTVTPESVLEAR